MTAAVRCVHASAHSLVCAAGKRAAMYGKGGSHFGWRDQPSWELLAALLAHPEHSQRCLEPLVASHPGIVNAAHVETGRSLLHHAMEVGASVGLLNTLIKF